MSNPFSSHSGGLSSPASHIEPVTPDDDNDLPGGTCRALLVGTAGTATIVDASGVEQSGVPLQQGFNPIGVRRVKTGGSAASLWALY
jgi:hypothetical protein